MLADALALSETLLLVVDRVPGVDAGERETEVSVEPDPGVTVSVALAVVELYAAVIFALVLLLTALVFTVTVAVSALAGIVTELGTVAAAALLVRVTTAPPRRSGLFERDQQLGRGAARDAGRSQSRGRAASPD